MPLERREASTLDVVDRREASALDVLDRVLDKGARVSVP